MRASPAFRWRSNRHRRAARSAWSSQQRGSVGATHCRRSVDRGRGLLGTLGGRPARNRIVVRALVAAGLRGLPGTDGRDGVRSARVVDRPPAPGGVRGGELLRIGGTRPHAARDPDAVRIRLRQRDPPAARRCAHSARAVGGSRDAARRRAPVRTAGESADETGAGGRPRSATRDCRWAPLRRRRHLRCEWLPHHGDPGRRRVDRRFVRGRSGGAGDTARVRTPRAIARHVRREPRRRRLRPAAGARCAAAPRSADEARARDLVLFRRERPRRRAAFRRVRTSEGSGPDAHPELRRPLFPLERVARRLLRDGAGARERFDAGRATIVLLPDPQGAGERVDLLRPRREPPGRRRCRSPRDRRDQEGAAAERATRRRIPPRLRTCEVPRLRRLLRDREVDRPLRLGARRSAERALALGRHRGHRVRRPDARVARIRCAGPFPLPPGRSPLERNRPAHRDSRPPSSGPQPAAQPSPSPPPTYPRPGAT